MPSEQLQEELQDELEQQDQAQELEAPADPVSEAEEDPDEVVITIGDEAPPEPEEKAAPEWVRDLRKAHREQQRRIKELESQLQTAKPEQKAVEVGKKPTLEDCDYDTEAFEEQLTAWHECKRQADQAAREAEQRQQAQQQEWQERLESYASARGSLKVKDYEDAELAVQEALNVTQQGIIIQGAENPALVVYALGKNPVKAKELSSINDPVKFAFAVAKLETQLKVQSRKPAPAPEKTVSGTAKISGSVDSTLDRLREEAARTGDMSKVLAYKRQQRAKA